MNKTKILDYIKLIFYVIGAVSLPILIIHFLGPEGLVYYSIIVVAVIVLNLSPVFKDIKNKYLVFFLLGIIIMLIAIATIKGLKII